MPRPIELTATERRAADYAERKAATDRLQQFCRIWSTVYCVVRGHSEHTRMTHWLDFFVVDKEDCTITRITGLMCRASPDNFTWDDRREAIRTRGSETGIQDTVQRLSKFLYDRPDALFSERL